MTTHRERMSRRAAGTASAVVVVLELVGALLMWAPIPLAWCWVGARVYDATGSIIADLAVVLLGSLATFVALMKGLVRLDGLWIALRRRAGHDQREGALNQVVIASATVGLLLFLAWYYVISDGAFVIPFMPTE